MQCACFRAHLAMSQSRLYDAGLVPPPRGDPRSTLESLDCLANCACSFGDVFTGMEVSEEGRSSPPLRGEDTDLEVVLIELVRGRGRAKCCQRLRMYPY
jgi:hypothetical protein